MMGLELVAFRLYAPYFGYSVYVWGSMISVVMAALTAGYALGGRLADRPSVSVILYRTILLSGAYQLVTLYGAPPLLRTLSDQGEFVGAGLATLLIFAPPMLALAATGPMIVRLCASASRIGSAAGTVYAISTAGGIAGILVTSFLLLPRVGTHRTLQVWCAVTFAAAVIGIVNRIRYPIALVPLVLAILVSPDLGWADNTVWTSESAYNLIRVVRQGTRTALLLNHQTSVHTVREESTPWTGYYYDTFALGPLLTHANSALVLGMGAGGSIQSIQQVDPNIFVDAVEIDPKVVEAATRWFALDTSDPHLRIHVADARPWLMKHHGTYDLVQVDLYQGGPYIPFYLITEEFFRTVRDRITANGLVMMNVFDPGANRELLASAAATLHTAFPSVMVMKGSSSNYMLLGFAAPRSVEEVRSSIDEAQLTPRLHDIVQSAMSSLSEMSPPPGTLVFTDDHAPVEDITRRMLAAYNQH
jgi:spermidine synthase